MWSSGKFKRRGPLGGLTALLFLVPMVLAACGTSGATQTPKGASSAASGTAAPQASGPPFGVPLTTKRGEGGTLKVLWWQAPTILNVHTQSGTKDSDAASVVTEPLARISATATVPDIPILAKEIPSVQNGGISADYKTVTWKLKDGVTWSDGMPFTADDVVFTWQFIANPENGSTSTTLYVDIDKVEAVDPTTAKVTFKAPAAGWFLPYVGDSGGIIPKHVVSKCPDAKNCDFNSKPIGTGPYVVKEFRPGDSVTYVANEKFREPNAPYFATVEMKGGGDATTAAQAVRTGDVDYAWNLQIAPEIVKQLQDAGKTVVTATGYNVEQLRLNNADPRTEVEGELSSPKSKNPFFSDPLVRQAMVFAIDRDSIAKNLYGPQGVAGNTIIPLVRGDIGKPFTYDLKKAGDLLDQAGWKKGSDGIREKNGVKMNMTFRTSVNSVRDKTGQVIKDSFKQLGIGLELKPVDASVYFGRPDNADALVRFTVDIEMYTTGSTKPDPQSFLEGFTTAQFAAKANNWGNGNVMKWSNPEYDKLFDQLRKELDPEKRKVLYKQLDDMIIDGAGSIPIVVRKDVFAHRPDLINNQFSPYSSQLWNVGHWTLKK